MNSGYQNENHETAREEARTFAKQAGTKIIAFLKKMSRIRLKIRKGNSRELNLPLLVCVVLGLINLPLTLLAAIVGVLCDYTYQVDMNGVTF